MTNIVEFPNLGIKAELNRVAFEIFGKEVYWYGVLIGIGFLVAVAFAFYRRKEFKITSENILDFILIGLPSAIVGARLFYVIGDASCRSGGLMEWIAIWDGGISIYGGLSFAILSCLIYLKKKKMNILRTLDFAAPSFMIGQIIGRWGNFVNVEVYGRATETFLKMRINGATEAVHPLFLYEGIWLLAGLVALVWYSPKRKRNGEVFSMYLIWYGAGRIWMESLRAEEYVLRVFSLPFSILMSIAIILIGIAIIVYAYKKLPPASVCNADCFEEVKTEKEAENAEETEKNMNGEDRNER